MKIIGFVGLKNSGKTFFVSKIIKGLTSKKIKVSSIKHAHKNFEIDKPKTDSFIHRESGSSQVIVSSPKRWAKITELKHLQEKTLNELLDELHSPEIVIVEGYKKENHPKIEIIKKPLDSNSFMFNNLENVIAIISDIKIASFKKKQFKKDQINEIIEFIINYQNE